MKAVSNIGIYVFYRSKNNKQTSKYLNNFAYMTKPFTNNDSSNF